MCLDSVPYVLVGSCWTVLFRCARGCSRLVDGALLVWPRYSSFGPYPATCGNHRGPTIPPRHHQLQGRGCCRQVTDHHVHQEAFRVVRALYHHLKLRYVLYSTGRRHLHDS